MQRFDVKRLLSSSMRRRDFLIGAGVMTGLALASQWPRRVVAQPKFSAYPFSLGVASGDPLPERDPVDAVGSRSAQRWWDAAARCPGPVANRHQ